MNVLTSGTPIFPAAVITCFRWRDDLRPMRGVRVQRVRVEAEAGDRQALGGRSRRGSRSPAPRTGWRRRCGWCRRSGGSGPAARGQQAISRTSKPLAAAQSATSMSGVSGNGAVRKPSFIAAAPPCGGGGTVGSSAADLHPATVRELSSDGVADEHLLVAVRERGVARVGDGAARERRRRRSREDGAERVGEALRVAAGQAAPPRRRRRSSAPGSGAGARWDGRGDRSTAAPAAPSPRRRRRRSRRSGTRGCSCGPG